MSKVVSGRPRQDQVADQRAGRGAAEEPDRGVSRLLRRPGRAAHRPGTPTTSWRPSRPCGRAACGSCTCPRTTTTSARRVGESSPLGRPGAARHPGRPRRRGLPAPDLHGAVATGPRSSSRSSSARAPGGSARATSRPSSRRSSGSRPARQPLGGSFGRARPRCSHSPARGVAGNRPPPMGAAAGALARRPDVGGLALRALGRSLRMPCRRSYPRRSRSTSTRAAPRLGVHAFRVECLRLHGTLPVPWISSFSQLNVRTYDEGLGGSPGSGSSASTRRARSLPRRPSSSTGCPGSTCRLELSERSGRLPRSRRREPRGGRSRPARRRAGSPEPALPGTLEHFLFERYCLYGREEGLQRAELHHRPWLVQPAIGGVDLNTMAPLGLPEEPPLLHAAASQDVLAWALEDVSVEPAAADRARLPWSRRRP